jgi:hypothetical protein
MPGEGEIRTYRGSCHCGAVRFAFASEPITRGVRCNCSICVRKGAVMSVRYVPRADFSVLEGLDALACYRWGDRVVNHYFCRTCGIYPFHDVEGRPPAYRINLGCVEGLDVLALPFDVLDGRSLPISTGDPD